ncbi:MAG: helix-turn-helix domain-containing protein [Negativicutes bacterium]|nr:helix-turn-helix domain-containing protein [Negativicutes bacterium]
MLLRIGDKIVNRQKIYNAVDEILEMRSRGFSQQEIAKKIGLDRTAISRLETLGEVRKGGRVALIGFPIQNCAELSQMARQEGVDYCLLLSEKERWEFVESKSGVELFNKIMEIISILRTFDIVIIIGSNMRIKLIATLLDKDVIGVQIGESPIAEDKYVDIEEIRQIIHKLH